MRRSLSLAILILLLTLVVGCDSERQPAIPDDGSVVRLVYFYADECSHCQEIRVEVLEPLQADFEERLEIRWIEITDPANYELLVRTEEHFDVAPEERGLPTLVIDGQVLIGQDQVRQELPCLLESCFAVGGTTWPDVPGLKEAPEGEEEAGAAAPSGGLEILLGGSQQAGACEDDIATACTAPSPIWVAYFYQVGCQECSRAKTDIQYVRSRYPQLTVEEFNVYDDLALAHWLTEHAGRDWASFHSPAVFIGTDALVGADEITPQALEALAEKYAPTGADRAWADADLPAVFPRIPSVLTVVFAGLVDGLNPCAFATLVFFVAYLAAGGRKGPQVLAVGGSFTLGVFLAYTAVGLGLYRVLDLVQESVPLAGALSRWVYGLTALLCAVLAILSFLDFLRARRGQVNDMSLTLPDALRTRVRAVIRSGQRMRGYVAGAFVTGLLVSLLELACTGQVYLPTIVYMTSVPELRAGGSLYLLLYNLLFILPLAVVFGMAYYGTTSVELGLLLKRRTGAVKLGTAVVFAALAVWLTLSLVM